MSNAIYTISFLETKDAEPSCFDNLQDCASDLIEVLHHDENAAYFVIKTTNSDSGDLTHETVTDDAFELACSSHVEGCTNEEDVAEWAKGSPSYEEIFARYAPAHADRGDLAA